MKTRIKIFLRRLATVLLGSALLSISVVIFLTAFGWFPFYLENLGGLTMSFDPYSTAADHRIIWTVISLVGAIGGVMLIWLGITFTRDQPRFLISAPRYGHAFGDVSVTVGSNGVRSLVAHLAENVEQVRQCDPTISLDRKGWKIACRVYVAPEAALPEVIDALRLRIRQSLEHHTGLPVFKLDIQTELLPLLGGM